MESAKIITRIEAKKIVDSVLGNNRLFYQQVSLPEKIISDDRMKEHMQIINGKWEDNDFVMNSIEKRVRYFQGRFRIRTPEKVI